MKTLFGAILSTIAFIGAIAVWVCGIATIVAIGAAVLKFIGVDMVAGMSYWLPLQTIGGAAISYLVTVLCAIGAAVTFKP